MHSTFVTSEPYVDVMSAPYAELRSWINGSVIVSFKEDHYDTTGTLLSATHEGVVVQGEIRVGTENRRADIFIPWTRIHTLAFTADATEPRPSTFPEYAPGRDKWAGDTQ